MATLTIEADYRSDLSKTRKRAIRRDGYVTASVFGRDAEPISLELRLNDLVKTIKGSDAGIMSLLELKVRGAPTKCDGTVIIKDFFKDPLTRKVLNIQFQRISMREKISMEVPILPLGEAEGTKEGGILEQVLDQLHVRCLPGDLPPRIEIDVSALGIGDHINVSEVDLGDAVEILTDAAGLIFTCVPPHVAKIEEEEVEAAEGEAEGEAEEDAAEAQEESEQ